VRVTKRWEREMGGKKGGGNGGQGGRGGGKVPCKKPVGGGWGENLW